MASWRGAFPMSSPAVIASPNWGAASTKGLRKKTNEDAHAFFTLKWGKEDKTASVMIVADGISSTEGGGRASKIAVETIKVALSEPSGVTETTSDRMAEALSLANQEILLEARHNPHWKRMGTTIVLALIVDARLYVMGLGDSRAYLIRKDKIHRLTTDHTWAQYTHDAQFQNGSTVAAAHEGNTPSSSSLVRYLGNPNGIHIDRGILSPDSGEKEEYISTQGGDTILLCTDGLYKLITDDELNQIVTEQSTTPSDVSTSLVSLARQRGETDDITTIVFRLPKSRTAAVTDSADKIGSGRLPVRNLRYVLAALIALLLLAFQFGYRQPEESNGAESKAVPQSTTNVTKANGDTRAPITQTPTVTSTLQPNATQEMRNSTLPPIPTQPPPTKILPTVALPTPTAERN